MSHQKMNRIERLREQVIEMGVRSTDMVRAVRRLISEGDNAQISTDLRNDEQQLDHLQVQLDEEAIALMTLFSPVAHNLRLIVAGTRITTEVERIGDQVMNICSFLQDARPSDAAVPRLEAMADWAIEMVEKAVEAFATQDVELAAETIAADDRLDALHCEVLSNVKCMSSTLIAQSLERIGDQATNVCEAVIYMVRGQDIRHAVPELLAEIVATPPSPVS